jgi:hypothetical protein
VKAGDGLGFRRGRVGVVVVLVLQRLGAEASAEGRGLLLQGVSRCALLDKGVSGGADALLGIGGGFEEGGLLRQLLAALTVGGAQRGSLIFQAFGRRESFVAELGRGSRGGRSRGGHGVRGAAAGARRRGRERSAAAAAGAREEGDAAAPGAHEEGDAAAPGAREEEDAAAPSARDSGGWAREVDPRCARETRRRGRDSRPATEAEAGDRDQSDTILDRKANRLRFIDRRITEGLHL